MFKSLCAKIIAMVVAGGVLAGGGVYLGTRIGKDQVVEGKLVNANDSRKIPTDSGGPDIAKGEASAEKNIDEVENQDMSAEDARAEADAETMRLMHERESMEPVALAKKYIGMVNGGKLASASDLLTEKGKTSRIDPMYRADGVSDYLSAVARDCDLLNWSVGKLIDQGGSEARVELFGNPKPSDGYIQQGKIIRQLVIRKVYEVWYIDSVSR